MADRRGLGVLFLVVVIDLLGWGLTLPLLPRLGERLLASDLATGLLSASFSAMQFLCSPWSGRLSDRIGRRPVLLAGLAASAACYLLFAYACQIESLALLFAARIGAGIAAATIPTAQAYIADRTSSQDRTGGMALIGAAFGVGFTLGPVIGALALRGQTDKGLPPEIGWWAAGLSALAFAVGWFRLPESLPATGAAAPRAGRFDATVWGALRTDARLPWLVFAFFASTLAFAQFESTLSPVLDRVFHLADRQSYWVFAYVGLTLVLLQGLLVRRLSKKLSDRVLATGGATLMLAGIAAGLACLKLQNLWALLALMPVLIAGFAMLTPALQAMVSKAAPADRQGAALGVNQSASALARILGQAGGIAMLSASVYLPYVVSAGLLLSAWATLGRLASRPAPNAAANPS